MSFDIEIEEPPEPETVQDDEGVLDVDARQEVVASTYEITSYGADYPVDGLVKRLEQGDIVVPSFDPAYEDSDEVRGFQRQFVWSRPQMDKFLESLLLGLPVPGIFLVRERSNVLLVLDGQQRLRTLQSFYRGIHNGREYRLRYATKSLNGRSYETLDDEDRRRLDDSIIHATILRQEHPSGSQDAVYSIFERLNTGGSALQPQEIRVALYHGPFLRLISEVNEDPNWRALYGAPSPRFKDQELILRAFALYEDEASYGRPVKGFLNHYLEKNRYREDAGSLADLFKTACQVINDRIGKRAFRPERSFNAAVFDSIIVAVMHGLNAGAIDTEPTAMRRAYDRLINDKSYSAVTTSSTASKDSVSARLSLAADAFQG